MPGWVVSCKETHAGIIDPFTYVTSLYLGVDISLTLSRLIFHLYTIYNSSVSRDFIQLTQEPIPYSCGGPVLSLIFQGTFVFLASPPRSEFRYLQTYRFHMCHNYGGSLPFSSPGKELSSIHNFIKIIS